MLKTYFYIKKNYQNRYILFTTENLFGKFIWHGSISVDYNVIKVLVSDRIKNYGYKPIPKGETPESILEKINGII